MTVSYFQALESAIPAEEARRSMQAAQIAVYPHLEKKGAESLWQQWEQASHPPEPVVASGGQKSAFTLNGRPVNIFELRAGLGAAMAPGGLSA